MSLGVVYQRQMVHMKRDSGAVVILRDAAAPNSIPAHTHPLSQLQQSGATPGQAIVWNGAAWVPVSIAAVPGGTPGQLQYNAAGVFGGLPLTYSAATQQLSHAPTWNDLLQTFTALGVNVTDTASAAGSRLLSLQVAGVDRAYVTKRGNARLDFVSGSWCTIDDGVSVGAGNNRDVIVGPAVAGLAMRQGQSIQFSANASDAYFDRSDLTMQRATNGGMTIYTGHMYADGRPALTLSTLNNPGSNVGGADRGFIRFQTAGSTSGTIGYDGGHIVITSQGNGLQMGHGAYHDGGHMELNPSGTMFHSHLNQYGLDTSDRAAFRILARKTGGAGALVNANLFRIDSNSTPGIFAIGPTGRLRFATTDSAPSDTTTPDAWITVHIGANGVAPTAYRMPLYLP